MALYTDNDAVWRQLRPQLEAKGVELMEADLRPEERFLMERFITGAMQLDRAPETKLNNRYGLLVNARLKTSEFVPQLRCVSLYQSHKIFIYN